MENHRIQICGKDWILRDPNSMVPLLLNHNKDEIIAQLPGYFRKRKMKVTVDVMDESGFPEKSLQIDPWADNTAV